MLKLISNQENVNLKAQWNITLYTTYMQKFKSLKMLLRMWRLADLYMGEKNSSITVAIKKKWCYKQARNIGESLDTWIKMHKPTETTVSKVWPKCLREGHCQGENLSSKRSSRETPSSESANWKARTTVRTIQ